MAAGRFQAIEVVDSHTAGEPTRVVTGGGPDLGRGSIAERLEKLKQHDAFRKQVVLEPRGSEVVVGALLCEPADIANTAGVIFFNDVGYLGMCGHGTIGLVTTLAHLGRIQPGKHGIETPAGTVRTELHADGSVSVENVRSYCYRQNVTVTVADHEQLSGDIAWGGNWFFLVHEHALAVELANRQQLLRLTIAIRSALAAAKITGPGGVAIDHVELFGKPQDPRNSSRNFVLCPGASFDRSPCGTGTSAKMACLAAGGKLKPGEVWRQEGILGTVFSGSIGPEEDGVRPTITGRAWITAEATLLFAADDPFAGGIVF